MSQYQLRVIFEEARSPEIWGPYDTVEEAEDVANRAETFSNVEDIYLEVFNE